MTINWDVETFAPSFRDLIYCKDRYLVLWGGRDSGKSYFAAQKMLHACLSLPYFRCILVKKTYESIKDSQYQTLKDIIITYGLDTIFDFKTSPLEITCTINGNRFIARGCDKPEKLKSIKDPSHAWYEEANQLSYEDFATVTSTIRGGEVMQEIFSFNPEYTTLTIEDFWIWKQFFKGQNQKTFNGVLHIAVEEKIFELPYTVHHSTYKDNPYITSERIAILEGYRKISQYMYDVFTKGEWSVKKVSSPFITAFERDKHLSEDAKYIDGKTIYISFDFNIDNTVCIFAHHGHESISVFDGLIAPDLPSLLDKIILKYGHLRYMMRITGDFAGRNRNALSGGDLTPYVLIKNKLNIKGNQIRLLPNSKHKDSRFLCNTIFAHHKNFKINPKLIELIYDIENVEVNNNEEIIKKDRNVANQKSDQLDCLRYLLGNFHADFVSKFRN